MVAPGVSRFVVIGLAAGAVIGCVRLAVVAASWPDAGPLLLYFALGWLFTMLACALAGLAIGLGLPDKPRDRYLLRSHRRG